jgi:hypothetical protein
MPLRFNAEVPNDDVDRIGVRKQTPVTLLFAQLLEGVFEANPETFVHFDHHS